MLAGRAAGETRDLFFIFNLSGATATESHDIVMDAVVADSTKSLQE
jgi:hypothetical protein